MSVCECGVGWGVEGSNAVKLVHICVHSIVSVHPSLTFAVILSWSVCGDVFFFLAFGDCVCVCVWLVLAGFVCRWIKRASECRTEELLVEVQRRHFTALLITISRLDRVAGAPIRILASLATLLPVSKSFVCEERRKRL